MNILGFDCQTDHNLFWMAYSTKEVGSFRTRDFNDHRPQPALSQTVKLLAQELPEITTIVFPCLDHRSNILVVDQDDQIERLAYVDGLPIMKAKTACDAVITLNQQICLAMPAADCPPITITGTVRDFPAIGIIHGSWKAVADGIIQRTLGLFDTYDDHVVKAKIGPGIGPCCYEVESDLVELFSQILPRPRDVILPPSSPGKEKFRIDINVALLQLLMANGLNRQHITLSLECTKCDNRYFSRRGGDDQQFIALAAVKP